MLRKSRYLTDAQRRLHDLHAVLIGYDDSAQIIPYLGYGTAQGVHVRGRVHRRYNVPLALDTDSAWRNIINTLKRFNSHELPYVRVVGALQDTNAYTHADDKGYFKLSLELDSALELDRNANWHTLALHAPDYHDTSASTQVLIPSEQAQFAVISDIDDTVLQSEVLNLLRLIRNTFFMNAHTRLPFAGVAEFYKALQGKNSENPIFYVSNSPWHLYDLLTHFFEIRGIPRGPLFMTDIGISPQKLLSKTGFDHKLGAIETLLALYPHLRFVLIGDSGEHDPAIYAEVVRRHGQRVAAVYIRDVRRRNDESMQAYIDTAAHAHVDMLLVPDTVVAAQHAAAHGLIDPSTLADIHREKTQDQLG